VPMYFKLSRKLHHYILQVSQKSGLVTTRNRYVPNGTITTSVRLACAIRYFAGGSPYDIMTTYQIGHADTMLSIWYVVEAINAHPELAIEYPTDHEEQRAVARGFQEVSKADFACCAGAIDGILIWTHKLTEKDCELVRCGAGKFFCGRKHKYGMNCQAICDARGKFLDLSIRYPGSSSDCLAFEKMSIFTKLMQRGFLAPGLCLFGDNAYINSMFMATPFAGVVSGGTKDAYNFFQSQVRIRIECAFGMLTHRWALLRSAIPMNISIRRTVALVMALAKLHNFCIDENNSDNVPSILAADELDIEIQGGVPLEMTEMTTITGAATSIPSQLIGAGNHFDELDRLSRRRRERQNQSDA
jgi:DDE superfamily endonuclease